jgi:scyllo-inositol 2-dehydrogenase (NADP+)
MSILRTAVIGLGRIGWQFHVPNVSRHQGFDLTAVVDPLDERLEEAKSRFGVKGYKDHISLLASEKLDLVVIASPTKFHLEHARAAFERGCHVFCDKPMAPTLEEADSMIGAMKKHGRKLMIYQPHRVGADIVALKEILSQNIMGPIYMIKRSNSGYARRNDWQAFRIHGGGMLNNYGAHYIDQSLYLSGSRSKRISCSLRTIASLGDADDVVKAVIETENGIILDIDINQATAQPLAPWQVLGKYGSAVLEQDGRAWHVRFIKPEELEDVGIQGGLAAEKRRYGSGETIVWHEKTFPISDFQPIDFYQKCYEYFALDAKPFVPVEETREVMRVLDVCRKSAELV